MTSSGRTREARTGDERDTGRAAVDGVGLEDGVLALSGGSLWLERNTSMRRRGRFELDGVKRRALPRATARCLVRGQTLVRVTTANGCVTDLGSLAQRWTADPRQSATTRAVVLIVPQLPWSMSIASPMPSHAHLTGAPRGRPLQQQLIVARLRPQVPAARVNVRPRATHLAVLITAIINRLGFRGQIGRDFR